MPTLILRLAIAIILLAPSLPQLLTAASVFLEMSILMVLVLHLSAGDRMGNKMSHIAAAVCLIVNRYIWPAAIITIFILVMGIVMIHFKEGWFVVGGGRNGVEFNFLMISVLVYLMMYDRYSKKKKI